MSRLQIQPATAADAPAVERVARESWHAAYDDVLSEDTVDRVVDKWYDLDRLRDAIERDEQIFVVATEGREVYLTEMN